MLDQERVSANLIAKLADEAAVVYRERKRKEGGYGNMRECLLVALKRHNLDRLSETFVKSCLSEMGRILGRRGQKIKQRNDLLRQEGYLPPLPKQQPSKKPLRFSEFLPFQSGNVWHKPMSA